MYRKLRFIIFLNSTGWLSACQIVSEAMCSTSTSSIQLTSEQDMMSLCNSVVNRARFPEHYSDLVAELQEHPLIVPLFEYAMNHLPTTSIACHVLAQAYARNKYQAVHREADNARAVISLCKAFEEQYPRLAASLGMYVYFYLPTSLRTIINNTIASHLSVERFFSQLPTDLRVVQFASTDDFSRTFVHIHEMRPNDSFALALDNCYAPFERYFAHSRHPLFIDYPTFCATFRLAFQKHDLYIMDIMRRTSETYQRTQPTFFRQALYDTNIVERPLLLAAFLIGQYDLVCYLLKHGAYPLQEIQIHHYLHETSDFEQDNPLQHVNFTNSSKTTVLEQALSLIPHYDVGSNPACDKAYRALIIQASEANAVLFAQIMRTNQSARDRIEQLMPEEFLIQLDIRERHSCCICQ